MAGTGAGAGGGEEGATTAAAAGAGDTSMEVFRRGDAFPVLRRVTFRPSALPFELRAEYDAAAEGLPSGAPRLLGRYVVGADAAAGAEEAGRKIRVDFRYDLDGIFSVLRAEVFNEIKEETPVASPPAAAPSPAADAAPAAAGEGAAAAAPDAAAAAAAASAAGGEKPMEVDGQTPAANGTEPGPGPTPTATPTPAPAPSQQPVAAAAAPKKRFKKVALPVSAAAVRQLPPASLTAAAEEERRMDAADGEIHATHDMRNALEAYIYATRGALEEAHAPFAAPAERDALSQELEQAESWLYDNMDGACARVGVLSCNSYAMVFTVQLQRRPTRIT
jgi:hypothetical protein